MKELKRLFPYLRKHRIKLILGFIFVTISNICSTFIPRIVGNIIDLIRTGKYTQQEIFYSILDILLLTIGSGLFMFLTRKTIIVSSRLIEYDLRREYLLTIEKQDQAFFHKHSTGSLMAYATNDISAAREFLGPAIMYGANTITTFTFVLYFMLSMNVSLTLFSLIPLPIIAIIVSKMGMKIHVSFRNVQEQFSNMTAFAQESFSGIRVIRAYVKEKFEKARFDVMSNEYVSKNLTLARYQAITMPILMILVGMSQLIVLGYGGWQVIEGKATLGVLTQFFIYLNILIWPVAAIGWITNIIQRATASLGRLGKVFDLKPEIIDDENTNFDIQEIVGKIEFDNVTLKYTDTENSELDSISFSIPEGSSLGIVGGVGSGKSSLIGLVPRLYDCVSGSIKIDGNRIQTIPLTVLRSAIGIVPQDTFLFSASIADNIRFGKPDATLEEIVHVAEIACLNDDIASFTDGFDTMLGERGITLSGGQKQRLAIARALIKNPTILILDDALSAVDTQTESTVLRELRKFMKNRTTIRVSHRISTVMDADNIIVLESGKIIEAGTHDELISLKGKYYDMFTIQQIEQELILEE
jgi:ATP-binding cassette subfamily B protein